MMRDNAIAQKLACRYFFGPEGLWFWTWESTIFNWKLRYLEPSRFHCFILVKSGDKNLAASGINGFHKSQHVGTKYSVHVEKYKICEWKNFSLCSLCFFISFFLVCFRNEAVGYWLSPWVVTQSKWATFHFSTEIIDSKYTKEPNAFKDGNKNKLVFKVGNKNKFRRCSFDQKTS